MKDIKSLYRIAKSTGKASDITAYSEAVHEMFESNPVSYTTNLEYIIQSDIGLKTLKQFVETKGLPISCYDRVMEILEKCIDRCKEKKKNSSSYEEAVSFMEKFHSKYIGCFMMESYFHDKLPDNYVSIYYGHNSAGIPNRKLAAGLIDKFGESVIPDVLVTANELGGSSMNTVLSFIEGCHNVGNPVVYEWVIECTRNLVSKDNPAILLMESKSISSIVRNVKSRNNVIFRESAITGNDTMLEYSESEINAIQDLISFNEYKLLWADELNESVMEIQKNIYSLYEEFDGLSDKNGDPLIHEETTATSVIPMLPSSNSGHGHIEEGLSILNTRNKKTGDIPGYLKSNHNLGYGEDDSDNHISSGGSKSDAEPEITLDDFKRPSAEDIATPYSGLDDKDDKSSDNKMTPEEQKAISNYYYYTFNNSMNKNTSGSFNRDHSTHTSTKTSTDDHSKNKRIRSDNNNSGSDDTGYEPLKESKHPWELDIFNDNDVYTEGVLGVLAGIVFVGPIILGTGALIAMMISSKIMDAKYDKKVRHLVSEIIGERVSDTKKYTSQASKLFAEFLSKNDSAIINSFYKLKESGEELDKNPHAYFTFGDNSKGNKTLTEFTADDLLLAAESIAVGLIKEDKIESVTKSLNKLSPDIKFGFAAYGNDLPGDDNGGDWSMFIKAGICDGGPEDCPNGDDGYGWIMKQHGKIEKSGYVVVRLSLAMPAKQYLIDNFTDKKVTESSEYLQEGWKDTLKSIASKVRVFFMRKKTLANIQRLDEPAVSLAKMPMTIPGTAVPIIVNNKRGMATESSDYTDEYTEAVPFLARRLTGKRLIGEEEIKKAVKKLRRKFNAEIRFVNPNTDQAIIDSIGFASVMETDRNTLNKLIKGQHIDRVPSKAAGDDSSKFEKVILVNSSMLGSFGNINSVDLEMIISHEYGHVLTLDQLSQEDWLEYNVKRNIMTSLSQAIYPFDQEAQIETNMYYYQLKPEKIANDAAGIRAQDLYFAVFKRKPGNKLQKLDLNAVLQWKVPRITMQLTQKTMSGNNNYTNEELFEGTKVTIDLYDKIIKDDTTKSFIMNTLKGQLSMFSGQSVAASSNKMNEAVGDADDNRPESDHPIKDVLTDIDRELLKKQQGAKRVVQNVQNVGRAFMKPAVRTTQWVGNMVNTWKDVDENKAKEKLADPHTRSNLFSAIKTAITTGSLFKAGLLLNPVFLVLSGARKIGNNKREIRLRNEMIGELKTEIEIIEEKIKDADRVGDNKAKYQLMRLKNEINKKLLRVGGGPGWKKII